jgi:hypothetical protein
MSVPPAAIIDVLNGLLESEMNSIFRFMGEGSPYLSRATADVRRPLEEMVRTVQRRVVELADLIDRLGGVPIPGPRGVDPEEQYLAFLSLKFLLPRLVHAKKLAIERYENAIKAIRSLRDARNHEVLDLLTAHLAEHQAQRKVLEKHAADVIAASR